MIQEQITIIDVNWVTILKCIVIDAMIKYDHFYISRLPLNATRHTCILIRKYTATIAKLINCIRSIYSWSVKLIYFNIIIYTFYNKILSIIIFQLYFECNQNTVSQKFCHSTPRGIPLIQIYIFDWYNKICIAFIWHCLVACQTSDSQYRI